MYDKTRTSLGIGNNTVLFVVSDVECGELQFYNYSINREPGTHEKIYQYSVVRQCVLRNFNKYFL